MWVVVYKNEKKKITENKVKIFYEFLLVFFFFFLNTVAFVDCVLFILFVKDKNIRLNYMIYKVI